MSHVLDKRLNRREFIGLGAASLPIFSVLASHLPRAAFAQASVPDLLNMSPQDFMINEKVNFIFANYVRYRAAQEAPNWEKCGGMAGQLPADMSGYFLINSPNPVRFLSEDLHRDAFYHWFDGDGCVQILKIDKGECYFAARQIETAKVEAEKSGVLAAGLGSFFGIVPFLLDQNTVGSLATDQGVSGLLASNQQAALSPVPFSETSYYQMGAQGDFESVNTANTTLTYHAGSFKAAWYFGAGKPYSLTLNEGTDGEALNNTGEHRFDDSGLDEESKKWSHFTAEAMSAHSKVDPKTGQLYYFSYFPSVNPDKAFPFDQKSNLPDHYHPKYTVDDTTSGRESITNKALFVSVVDQGGKMEKCLKIDLPGPRHIHDIAISESSILVFDTPSRAPLGAYIDNDTRVGILPKSVIPGTENDVIKWVSVDSSYILHTCNAYDDGDNVVLTATRVEDTVNSSQFKGKDIPQIVNTVFKAHFYEWIFDRKKGELVREGFALQENIVNESKRTMIEYPVVPQSLVGNKSRYSYMCRMEPSRIVGLDAVIKHDNHTNTFQTVAFNDLFNAVGDEQYYGSEMQFVPNPQSWSPDMRDQDNGWLVLFGSKENLYPGNQEPVQIQAWVLDAKDLTLVAQYSVPTRMPKGFHSLWVSTPQ